MFKTYHIRCEMIGLKEFGRFYPVLKDLKLKGSFEVNNRKQKPQTAAMLSKPYIIKKLQATIVMVEYLAKSKECAFMYVVYINQEKMLLYRSVDPYDNE